MKRLLAGSLGIGLGLLGPAVYAEDYAWRPVPATVAPAVADDAPLVSLGKPVAVSDPAPTRLPDLSVVDHQIVPASYGDVRLDVPRPYIVRGQAPNPDPIVPPPLPSAGPAGVPPPPVTIDPFTGPVNPAPPPPAAAPATGFWGKVGGCLGMNNGRCTFQSDHCFDSFISPVSNPFLFEDPRSLTEIRPVFITQGTPDRNRFFHGGDIEYLGVEGRLALTDRLSVVMTKAGWDWTEVHDPSGEFQSHAGFSEIWLGPKYTFLRCENSGTLAAAGLNFQIPIGESKVFQDTGDLSLEPYISFGQEFRWPGVGNFHFLNTTGYTFGVDSKRTDYFFSSFHLDYDLLNTHHIYPLVELNWFHYTSAGDARALNFEGTDLFNFGSKGVSGQDLVTLALGARFKLNEAVQTGFAVEFPLTSQHELQDYRLTFDVIFRF